jgi:ferrous-iron efflux pump FieF
MNIVGTLPETGADTSVVQRSRGDRLKRWAATASVTVAAVLIGAKAIAWLATGSVSLLSTLVDSLLDLAASILNLIAIRQATQPADREHRFGHGKAEPLAGLAQAAFVGGSAAFLLFQSIERLVHPVAVANSTWGYAVMGLSIALTLMLVIFQHWVIRRTGSVAVGADSLHYRSDLFMNLSVVAALFLSSQVGWHYADPLFAIGIAVYITFGAWTIFNNSFNLLMDRELPEADRARIIEVVSAHPRVLSIHDLRTRSSGTQAFIQFHLELDAHLTLLEAHEIAEEVMTRVEAAFPGAEVLIHEDPFGVEERRVSFD